MKCASAFRPCLKILFASFTCAVVTMSTREARAVDILSIASAAISIAPKLYDASIWANCHVGNQCPKSDVQQQTEVILDNEQALVDTDTQILLGKIMNLMEDIDAGYRNFNTFDAQKESDWILDPTKESLVTLYGEIQQRLYGTNALNPNEVDFAYQIAPVFSVLSGYLDNVLQTVISHGRQPIDLTFRNQKRDDAWSALYALVGSKAVWYQCASDAHQTVSRTTDSFDNSFTTKKLWKKFADYKFAADDCMDDCNVFRRVSSPSQAMCVHTLAFYCVGGIVPCGCVGESDQSAYQTAVRSILANMDGDPVVSAVRSYMDQMTRRLGYRTVNDSHCGSGSGQLGSELEMASSTIQFANSRYEIVDVRGDGTLYHNSQAAPGSSWSGEETLNDKATQAMLFDSGGDSLTLFYVTPDDALYRRYLSSGWWGSSWNTRLGFTGSDWQPLPARQFTVARKADDHPYLFFIDPYGNIGWALEDKPLYYTWSSGYDFRAPDASISCCNLEGETSYRSNTYQGKRVAAAANADGRMELFIIGTDDAIYHTWQTAPDSGVWIPAVPLGGAAKEISVIANYDGTLDLFYIGMDNAIYHNQQVAPNSGWSGESPMNGAGKQLTVGRGYGGSLDLFVVGTDDVLYGNSQILAGGWAGFFSFGSSARHVAVSDDGAQRLSLVGADNALYQDWWYPGGWAGPYKLYGAPTAQQVTAQVAAYRDESTMFNDGVDWDQNYGKASCAQGWRINGLSSRGSVGEAALCVGPHPSFFSPEGQVTTTLFYDGVDHRRAARTADILHVYIYGSQFGALADWDYGYVKHECGYGEYVAGISEGVTFTGAYNNRFHAIQCASGAPGSNAWSINACTVHEFAGLDDRASSYEGDWDSGAYKTECDVDQYLAGVSVDSGSGNVHRLLCCNNNP